MLIYKCNDLTNSSGANNSDECENVHAEARLCRRNLLIGGWAVGAGVRCPFVCMCVCVRACVHACVCVYI